MSQTGSNSPKGDAGLQPLILYNAVHHRDGNPLDCAGDATAKNAAQIYNAVITQQFPMSQQQIDDVHPLNFASIGAGGLDSMLKSQMDALANIARGQAEAEAVMLENFQKVIDAASAQTADTRDDLVEALALLDAMIRAHAQAATSIRG